MNKIANDKAFIETLDSQIATDEEVMFVGKKVNNLRNKAALA